MRLSGRCSLDFQPFHFPGTALPDPHEPLPFDSTWCPVQQKPSSELYNACSSVMSAPQLPYVIIKIIFVLQARMVGHNFFGESQRTFLGAVADPRGGQSGRGLPCEYGHGANQDLARFCIL